MKAVVVSTPGGPEVLEVVERQNQSWKAGLDPGENPRLWHQSQ